MKNLVLILITLVTSVSFSQEKEQLLALKKANEYVYEGNALEENDDFVSAEMEYRKAISKQPTAVAGVYNLGNSYYKKGNFEEALYRHEQAAKTANSKSEKHKAFHNIGNILMQNKKCKEAVEAFKNALRNDPTDDETRYNYALAKECAEQQKQDQQDENKDDQNKDKNEDNKENQDQKDNKDNKDKEGDKEDENKDKGDQDKKDGEDEKDDEGKPKDEKEDKGKGDQEKKEQPKPQPGQLSPQQIKNLLEAMNNQEQKVQEKMNEEKQKGVKIKTEKDW
jgi:tetratricopeptide (TPR) repeat protein